MQSNHECFPRTVDVKRDVRHGSTVQSANVRKSSIRTFMFAQLDSSLLPLLRTPPPTSSSSRPSIFCRSSQPLVSPARKVEPGERRGRLFELSNPHEGHVCACSSYSLSGHKNNTLWRCAGSGQQSLSSRRSRDRNMASTRQPKHYRQPSMRKRELAPTLAHDVDQHQRFENDANPLNSLASTGSSSHGTS